MKTKIIYLIVLLNVQFSYSQIEPEWIVRNDLGYSAQAITVDNSGNVYVAGYGTGFITIKYNSSGALQWVQTNMAGEIANAIVTDNSGNVYVTGQTSNVNPHYDYLTIKYDSNGVQQWVRTYNATIGQDKAYSIVADNIGNVYVTGSSYSGSGPATAVYSDDNHKQVKNIPSDMESTGYDYATIKYSSSGEQLWVQRYNSSIDNDDYALAMVIDTSGNVYVTGSANDGIATIKYSSTGAQQWVKTHNGSVSSIVLDQKDNVYVVGSNNSDYITIKYTSNGAQEWVKTYNGPGNSYDYGNSVTVGTSGNVYVTGSTTGSGTGSDYVTIKYDSTGVQQWVKRYNGKVNGMDAPRSVGLDALENVYVTGQSTENGIYTDYTTIKYNLNGEEHWVHSYNGPGDNNDFANALMLDNLGNVYVTGSSWGSNGYRIATIKYPGASEVYDPAINDKWIAGETDTIRWTETSWLSVNIKCILNFETLIEEDIILAEGYPVVNSEFEWEITDTLLSYRSKIIIENANNPVEKIESDIFRIKPYVLTRLNEDSTYYDYRKDRDQWGFSNMQADIWPQTWYNQFNYQGTDPFTNNLQYSQTQGDSTFGKSRSHYHPDWVSWVNTFGENACYFSAYNGVYKPTALAKWWATSNNWGGSCFGIAAANAIAFSYRAQFTQAFPTFPVFLNPVSVDSSNGVRFIVNELFAHQYGNPTQSNDPSALAKTPNQTLEEIRQMFLEDTAHVKTLSIYNNGGSGGHTIFTYGLKQDAVQKNLYYVYVYDNSNPNSNNPITIDTLANGGTGSWSTPDWAGWGGNGKIHLEIPSTQYLNGATFPARSIQQSAFILPQNVLEINYSNDTQIRIIDNLGNITGYVNNLALNEIPGSLPQMIRNGSETPPYSYSLQTNNYSVVLDEFEEDTVNTFFFTGNKSFVYERSGAVQTQTDKLFFDGGVSVSNPDAQTKIVKLLNLINETTQEKLTVLRSIELAQNDSVKIENPDSNKIKLISYGSAKDYDIELNYVTENGLGRFGDYNILLSANTSHIFIPDWTDLTNTELQVLVDIGNDGTIDDTLTLVNQITGVENEQGSLLTPNSYNLAQNYPNPFNPTTKLSWQSPVGSHQTLKVYDVLGNEVVTLVNEYREAGRYEIELDASRLSSGIYFYRLQAGSFVETRKMILVK